MIKKILLALIALVVVSVLAILGVASTKPATYRVERAASIAAAPATVFGLVNDFHRWPEWSPWENLDPAMKKTFDGPQSGAGSSYAWAGNDQVGEGKMTITESVPDLGLAIRLEFIKPWKAVNDVRFAFTPAGPGTDVHWSMNGNHNFVSKVMCVFVSMDQLIGKDLETGLENLKALAESTQATQQSEPSTPATADTVAAPGE